MSADWRGFIRCALNHTDREIQEDEHLEIKRRRHYGEPTNFRHFVDVTVYFYSDWLWPNTDNRGFGNYYRIWENIKDFFRYHYHTYHLQFAVEPIKIYDSDALWVRVRGFKK